MRKYSPKLGTGFRDKYGHLYRLTREGVYRRRNSNMEFTKKQRKILADILSTGDIEDYSREQYEEYEWNGKDFEAYNELRSLVGLEPLEIETWGRLEEDEE